LKKLKPWQANQIQVHVPHRLIRPAAKNARQESTYPVAQPFGATLPNRIPTAASNPELGKTEKQVSIRPGEDPTIQSRLILLLTNLTTAMRIVKDFLRRSGGNRGDATLPPGRLLP
jgi:hypothetical protein